MELGYFAADTLGVTLHQMKAQLIACETRQMVLGPWKFELPVSAESDILSGTEVSFWMTLATGLQLYVIVREKENWLFVLHEDTLADCEQRTRFEGQTTKARVLEIKPAIKAVFHWTDTRGKWAQVQFDGIAMEK